MVYNSSLCNLLCLLLYIQKQTNRSDCGVFAIAYATAICLGSENFTSFETKDNKMREHLVDCLSRGYFTPFPPIAGHTADPLEDPPAVRPEDLPENSSANPLDQPV